MCVCVYRIPRFVMAMHINSAKDGAAIKLMCVCAKGGNGDYTNSDLTVTVKSNERKCEKGERKANATNKKKRVFFLFYVLIMSVYVQMGGKSAAVALGRKHSRT